MSDELTPAVDPRRFYSVTVEEGHLPTVVEHKSAGYLADYLREIVDQENIACYVFYGERVYFTTGRIPHLLLDNNSIPLVDNDMTPCESGLIGYESELVEEADETPAEESAPFPDSGNELPDDDDDGDDLLGESWDQDDEDD